MIQVFKTEKGRIQVLESYDKLLKDWKVAYWEVDLRTKYGNTHCILFGEEKNPPLLLFHGVGDNSAVMWLMNAAELSRYFYCIAVDTLGGPGKSVPNENFNKKNFHQVDWINETVAALKIENFHIAGVSNGGYMAYNYAVNEPKKVNRVVCIEGGMLISPLKSFFRTILMLFPEMLIPTRANKAKAMLKLTSPNSGFRTSHPEVIDYLVTVLSHHNQKAMFAHSLEKYDKSRTPQVRNRILFLIGDHMLKRGSGRNEFIDILKDAGFRYKIIENAGHAVNHEQPEIVNREIAEFLLNPVEAGKSK